MRVAPAQFAGTLPPHDLLIDALVGYGLEAAPRGVTKDLIIAANASPAPTISLDAPSGIDVDTGATPGEAIRAEATLTLALPKTGLLKPEALSHVGDLYVADIGVPASVFTTLAVAPSALFAGGPLVRIVR